MDKRIAQYERENAVRGLSFVPLFIVFSMLSISGCIDVIDHGQEPQKIYQDIEVMIELDSMNEGELGMPDIDYFDEVLNDSRRQNQSSWNCEVAFKLNRIEDDTSPSDHPAYYSENMAEDEEGNSSEEKAIERGNAWEDRYWTADCEDLWEASLLYAYSYSKDKNGSDPEKRVIMGLTPVPISAASQPLDKLNESKHLDKWSVVFIQAIRNFCDRTSGVMEYELIAHVISQELGHQWDIDLGDEGCNYYCAMSNSLDPDILRICYFCKEHFRGFQQSPSCTPSDICKYMAIEQSREDKEPEEDRPLEYIRRDESFTSNVLSLSIEPDMDEYHLGEPIRLLVTLKNISDRPVHILDSIDPLSLFHVVGIIVYYPEGKTLRYRLPIHVTGGISDKENYKGYVLEPGEALRDYFYPLLSVGVPGYLFPKAGTYGLRAVYEVDMPENKYLWQGKIASESIEISIREPRENDREALKLFEKLVGARLYGDLYAISHTREDIDEDRAVFDELIYLYPQSVYTKYAWYYKALSYVKEDSKRALEFIAELQRRYPSFRTEELAMGKARCYYELGMQRQLSEEVTAIRSDPLSYPSVYFFGLKKIINELEAEYEKE